MNDTTAAKLALSLKVQVCAQYLRYIDMPGQQAQMYAQAFHADNLTVWATEHLEVAIADANASEMRGAVVRNVSDEAMARLWEMGLDKEICVLTKQV